MAEILAKTISGHLAAGKVVLWLLSGGSAIKPAVEASKLLDSLNLGRLTISLADERYGKIGHPDSNWQSLVNAGFNFGNSTIYPILIGRSAGDTIHAYNQFLESYLSPSVYKLALLGLGADGHTAGILPHSPAVNAESYAAYYEASDFKRLTITARGLASIDEAIIYCVGANKANVLDKLGLNLSVADQPAQIIKRIPKLSVYNDIKGAKL